MNNEEMTKGILDIVEHIVLDIDTTSQTEAQRKLFIILISYVMSTYWSEAYQQKLINYYHSYMIGYMNDDFENMDELMEVVKIFEPLIDISDTELKQDKKVVQYMSKLLNKIPEIYEKYSYYKERIKRIKHSSMHDGSHPDTATNLEMENNNG